jgi:hypothetical protein
MLRDLLARQCPVERFRVLTKRESLFLEPSGIGIHQSNLLKLGVEIYSYSDHRSTPFSEPVGWPEHHQLYSGVGADIVMESITLPRKSSSTFAFRKQGLSV